jgi:hypothetical protein
MASDWNDDFLDLVDCLAEEEVEYIVVGAFALAQHGLPRATGDIDFLVRPSSENAVRVHRALARFGAPLASAQVVASDFELPGTVYQIGVAPRRIDILTEATGLSFDEAWRTRLVRAVDGREIPFLALEPLLKNKRATGRPKDAADAQALEKLHPGSAE